MVRSFGPLYRVRGRLFGRQLVEQHYAGTPPKRLWGLTLRYDEVAALMLILPGTPAAGLAWREIQRVSLNLEQFIEFAPS